MPTSTTPLPARVRAFLETPRYAAIATTDPDGAPRQAVIWFRLDGDTIVINSLEGRRWPSNLRRDPRISVAVTDATTENWVGITGTVEVVDDQARAQADIAAMARRYHAADPAHAEELIELRFSRSSGSASGSRPIAIHDHLDED